MSSHIKSHDIQYKISTGPKIHKINNEEAFGQRRKLIKSLLNLEAINNAIEASKPKPEISMRYSSEYNDNFCNYTMLKSTKDDEIRIKYPLYGGSIQTVYSQLINEGMLKNRKAITDISTPFKRNNVMSLSFENN